MHRVARPHHGVSGIGDRPDDRRQPSFDVVGTHAADERQPAGQLPRVQPCAQFEDLGRVCRRTDLATERVADTTEELDVGAVGLVRALADPQHVGRAVVPVAGEAVLAGERLFVAEDQCLVAGEDVDLAEIVVRIRVDAGGAHEPQRPVDLAGDSLVALSLGTRRDELLVPRVDTVQSGEPALGERPQQVQRGRGLVVRLDQAIRIGDPRLRERARVVDDVAAEGRQVDLTDALCWTRTGLGELAGDASNLHHRDAHRIRQHDGHLQDDAQLLADVVGGELLEALGTVAGLEQKGIAGSDLGQ